MVPFPAPEGPSMAMITFCTVRVERFDWSVTSERMRSRRLVAMVVAVALMVALVWAVTPYVRAASLIVRAADLGGPVEAFANERARAVTVRPPHMVPTRQGDVLAQFYEPAGSVQRTVLLLP